MSPLKGVEVRILNANGTYASGAYSGPDGVFTADGLRTGTYFASAMALAGYGFQLYNGIDCPPCHISIATPINVTLGYTTGGISFRLKPLGRVTGRVTSAETNLPLRVSVVAIDKSSWRFLASVVTGSDGTYSFTLNGNIWIATDVEAELYTDEVWPNISCDLYCDSELAQATPLQLSYGTVVSNIDFALDRSKPAIEGVITDNSTRLPLSATVHLRRADDGWSRSIIADASGHYSFHRVSPGTYKLSAELAGYAKELHDNTLCGRECQGTPATPIVVGGGEPIAINFALDRLGKVTGQVLDRRTGRGIPNASIQIQDPLGPSESTQTDANGRYVGSGPLWSGLIPGVGYYVQASAAGYDSVLHRDQPSCTTLGCFATQATPVQVAPATSVTVDFAMTPLGKFKGRVIDDVTRQPVAGATVSVSPIRVNGNEYGARVTTDAAGYYETQSLRSGLYQLQSYSDGYVHTYYSCGTYCPESEAVRVPLKAGDELTIDFALERGGRISGVVVDAYALSPIPFAVVRAWHARSRISVTVDGMIVTDQEGRFTTPAIFGSGDYYLSVSNQHYRGEFYDDVPCAYARCFELTSSATPIPVMTGATTDIRVRLSQYGNLPTGTISGRVVEHQTQRPLSGVALHLFDLAGTNLTTRNAVTNGAGEYSLRDLPPAGYFLLALNELGYRNVLFDGLSCEPSCVIATGTPLYVKSLETTRADFTLHGDLYIHRLAPSSGGLRGGIAVQIDGIGFRQGLYVTVGGGLADVTSVSPTSILATVPPGAEGPVDVTVRNPDGTTSTRANGFTYINDCVAPSIFRHTSDQTVRIHDGTTLRVEFTGSDPFLIQWYIGLPGDTSRPVGGNSASLEIASVTETTSFWARVTNACGTVETPAMRVMLSQPQRRRGVRR